MNARYLTNPSLLSQALDDGRSLGYQAASSYEAPELSRRIQSPDHTKARRAQAHTDDAGLRGMEVSVRELQEEMRALKMRNSESASPGAFGDFGNPSARLPPMPPNYPPPPASQQRLANPGAQPDAVRSGADIEAELAELKQASHGVTACRS